MPSILETRVLRSIPLSVSEEEGDKEEEDMEDEEEAEEDFGSEE